MEKGGGGATDIVERERERYPMGRGGRGLQSSRLRSEKMTFMTMYTMCFNLPTDNTQFTLHYLQWGEMGSKKR